MMDDSWIKALLYAQTSDDLQELQSDNADERVFIGSGDEETW